MKTLRHPREGGNPVLTHDFKSKFKTWVPAFAGMTGKVILFSICTFAARPQFGTANISVGFTPGKTCFSVSYRGESSPYKVTPLFVLPNEEVALSIEPFGAESTFDVAGAHGAWSQISPVEWTWKAPAKPGAYSAQVTEAVSGETMDLNIFVMVPYGKMKDGVLNGYRIGDYPKAPANKAAYSTPRGFIEVTDENRNTRVSPHFTLGQFLCKQSGSNASKYVVLRERLIFKLELLLEHVNSQGIPARTFSVMSGYRTPFYNKALGNVKMSRHMWGDAADIYINDTPGVVGMEDLNGDGRSTGKDAELLYEVMDELNDEPAFKKFLGGLGWYKPTKAHGPFVHVDARGTAAHWSSEN